jgi:hypothetical protein
MISWTETLAPETSSSYEQSLTDYRWFPNGISGFVTRSLLTTRSQEWSKTESFTEIASTEANIQTTYISGRTISVFGAAAGTEIAGSERTITVVSTANKQTSTTRTTNYTTSATGSTEVANSRWTTSVAGTAPDTSVSFYTEPHTITTTSTTASGTITKTIDQTTNDGSVLNAPLRKTVYLANTRDSANVIFTAAKTNATNVTAPIIATNAAQSVLAFTRLPNTQTAEMTATLSTATTPSTIAVISTALSVNSFSLQNYATTSNVGFVYPNFTQTANDSRAVLSGSVVNFTAASQSLVTFTGAPRVITVLLPSITTLEAYYLDTSYEQSAATTTTTTRNTQDYFTTSSSTSLTRTQRTWTLALGPPGSVTLQGEGTITESEFSQSVVSRTTFQIAESGVSTSLAVRSRRNLLKQGVADGTASLAGYYSANLSGYFLGGTASVYPRVTTIFPQTRIIYTLDGEEFVEAGTASISGSAGTATWASAADTFSTFSLSAVGDPLPVIQSTQARNGSPAAAINQTFVEFIGKGGYRDQDRQTFTTEGQTGSFGSGTSFLEPLTVLVPSAVAGDPVWTTQANQSNTTLTA